MANVTKKSTRPYVSWLNKTSRPDLINPSGTAFQGAAPKPVLTAPSEPINSMMIEGEFYIYPEITFDAEEEVNIIEFKIKAKVQGEIVTGTISLD